MKTAQDIIVRLLANIGSRKEVEQYLRHYASVEAPKFAVIKVSGSVIAESLDMLASSLSFLASVGLVPIVVHGAGAQIERALADAKIDAPVVGDGLWRMTPEVLDVARRTLLATGASIADALEGLGTRARPYTSGILEVTTRNDERLGLTADVVRVADGPLAAAARSGIIPVVSPFGETSGGQIAIVHADVAAREIALALRPHKIVFLSSREGLVDDQGQLLSAVNLAEDYDAVVAADSGLTEGSRSELTAIKGLLEQLPPATSVSITSPDHLARELFTHRGAGTLVRRGERIRVEPGFDAVDVTRLKALLEQCFGRKLKKDYFTTKKPFRVYLAESYRATAILTHEEGLYANDGERRGGELEGASPRALSNERSVPYLDKFAVTPEAQGEGIGGSIWQRMLREVPKLFWRARATNPVNAWYAQQADGLYKTDEWWVFWCGMTDFGEIEACVKRALAMPATLKGSAPDKQAEAQP